MSPSSKKTTSGAGTNSNKGSSSGTNGVGKRQPPKGSGPVTRAQTQSGIDHIKQLDAKKSQLSRECEFLRRVTTDTNEPQSVDIEDLKKKEEELRLVSEKFNQLDRRATETSIRRPLPSQTAELEVEDSSAPDGHMSGVEEHHNSIEADESSEDNHQPVIGVDDLGIKWDIGEKPYQHDLLSDVPKEVLGHLVKMSSVKYCVRYGSYAACSSMFKSTIPYKTDTPQKSKDVTQRSNRIIERIIQHHKDRKEPLPMNTFKGLKFLSIYWDSKTGVGHHAEVDVLRPDYRRRPHTRCFVYLPPENYAKYGLENTCGYSHETYTVMKRCVEGTNNWQKCVTIHNIAVELENQFEAKYMKAKPGRSTTPLSKIMDGEPAQLGRSYLPSRSPSHGIEPWSRQSPGPASRQTPRRQVAFQDASSIGSQTPPPDDHQENLGASVKRFHQIYLLITGLPANTTYMDLSDEQQVKYMENLRGWEKIDSQQSIGIVN